jgi:hypothetical protein
MLGMRARSRKNKCTCLPASAGDHNESIAIQCNKGTWKPGVKGVVEPCYIGQVGIEMEG